MQNIILEVARYMIILLMVYYTWQSFVYFFSNTKEKKRKIVNRQNLCLAGVHVLGYLSGYLATGKEEMIFLYGAQAVYFLCVIFLFRVFYPESSHMLMSHMCMLMSLGFVLLARLSFSLAVKQFAIVCAGTVLVSVIPWIMKKNRALRKLAWLYGAVGMFLLLWVYLRADTTNGAKLFLDFKYFSLQPSEFVKLVYVFFIAAMFEKSGSFRQVVITSLMAAVHVLLLVASKDLGGALIYALVYLFMLYAATGRSLYLFGGLLCGSAASWVAWKCFDHIQVRVTAWLDPWSVIENKGYQIAQSLFAIGTGGFFGTGLYQGSPGQIPVVEQDFIFSALAEELGGVVALCVILICLSCLLLFFYIARESGSPFYRYLTFGLAATYGIQVFLTIGGAIKLIPSTGVTLPLVSYGGSSVLSTLCMFAVMQGVYIQKKEKSAEGKKEISRMMVLFAALFFLLSGYLVWFLIFQSRGVIQNPYNLRQENLEKKIVRGSIYSADGEVLAETRITEAGEETRVYPYDNLFSHVVGYSQNGKTGLELKYNFELLTSDIPIYEKIYLDFSDEKSPGDEIVTTLSVRLQQVAEEAMEDYRGAVVVLEPSTGKILAMVSKPDYNPNTILADWESLIHAENTDGVLLNRATQGLYPPGSTFKIVTALQYLRENPSAMEDFSYECSGIFSTQYAEINCYHGTSHGSLDFTSAFAKSCNGAFAQMAATFSASDFAALCNKMLFNTELPYPLAYRKSSFSLTEETSDWELLQMAIGQGTVEISPLHNALITAAVANGGVLMKPYLVTEIRSVYRDTVKQYLPTVYERLMTPEEAAALTRLMTACVTDGTGYAVLANDYTAAGKTGTAEWHSQKASHSWFVGFAPAENPRIVVSVVLEEAGTGSDHAAPVARKIFDAFFENP